MTAPNLKSPTTITGKTARAGITTTAIVGIVTNAGSSGKVLKINSILCANVDGTNAADISVSIYDGSTDRYIAKEINVPAKATQILCAKDTYFYLEENDSIRAVASAASDLELVIGYEDIS